MLKVLKGLIVDDELAICKVLERFLEENGIKASYALSGKEALERDKEDFDLFLLDLKLPDISGIEILKRIKAKDNDLPVIIITGYPSFESVQEAIRLGAYDYITKPFNLEEIGFIVKKAMEYRYLVLSRRDLLKTLERKVEERTKQLKTIYEISKEITSSLDLDRVLETIIEKIKDLLDIEICSILLCDEEEGVLRIKKAIGLEEGIIEETRIAKGELISGWIFEKKEPILVKDIEQDPIFRRRNRERYYTHSFISTPLLVKGRAIGVINVNNKRSKEIFKEEELQTLVSISSQAAISIENARLFERMKKEHLEMIESLILTLDAKDFYTYSHSKQVIFWAEKLAKKLNLSGDQIENIKIAAALHDVGKIAVSGKILLKEGPLDEQEWEEMKRHVLESVKIIKPLSFLGDVVKIIEQHHERCDGSGYPYGLKGEEISLGGKILAICDSFSAMRVERPYRRALTKEETIEELKKDRGKFSPQVLDAFLELLAQEE
jgi:putative nucleotidyltransferase with HDIG domain